MWEEIDAECMRIIERDEVDQTIRLSRRHRWKPLAFDIAGDAAVVVVATRGKRAGGQVTSLCFERRGSIWEYAARSGAGVDDPVLPPPTSRGGALVQARKWGRLGERIPSALVAAGDFGSPQAVEGGRRRGRG